MELMGYNPIAPNAESTWLPLEYWNKIKKRWKRIVIFGNNDWLTVPQVVNLIDQPIRVYVNPAITTSIVRIKWVRTVHFDCQFRHSFRGIGPRPGSGKHAVEMNIANPVCQELMCVTMNNYYPVKPIQNSLDFFGVVSPEIPLFIQFAEGRVGEDNDWCII